MSDREIIVDFISDLNIGVELPDPDPRICYIPKRKNKSMDLTNSERVWTGRVDPAFKYFYNPFGFTAVSDPSKELTTRDRYYPSYISSSWLEKIMSNVYLYEGYIRHVLTEHLISYLKGEYDNIKIRWSEFCPNSTHWSDVFSFKIEKNVKELREVYHRETMEEARPKNRARKNALVLYKSEGDLLARNLGPITKINMLYYLLLRDVHS